MGNDIGKNEYLAYLVNKYADMVLSLAITYLGNRFRRRRLFLCSGCGFFFGFKIHTWLSR
jgi:hypothetical protein